MKKNLKRIAIKIFDPIAKKLGYTKPTEKKNTNVVSENYSKDNLLDNLWSLISNTSFCPNHIVDIGANHGTWTRRILHFYPLANYTLLEPQAELKESIADILENNPNVRFFGYGAGNKSGTFKFTIANRDDSSNFRLSEEEAIIRGLRQIEVPVTTLDELIRDENLAIPDIVKIDAEGLDIEVLDGCSTLFGKTEVFMVEAAVANKQFNNNLRTLLNYMDDKGYRLFDFTDLNRPFEPSVLWLIEVVFIKKGGILDSQKWF